LRKMHHFDGYQKKHTHLKESPSLNFTIMLDIEKIQKRFPYLSLRDITEQYDRDITRAHPTQHPAYRDFPRPPPAQGELFVENRKRAEKTK